MKRILVTLMGAGILALGTTAFSQGSSVRIVLVDLTRVFNEYYKTPIAAAKLKDTAESYKKEQDDTVERYKQQTAELDKLREEADKTEYTPEVREQKKKAVQEKLAELKKTQEDFTEYGRSHDQMLAQQRERMRQTILGEIREVVNKQAKDAGYTLVLDKSGNTFNQVPTILYSQDTMDITDDVIKTLNKNQPKTSDVPKPAATPSSETPKTTGTPKPQDKKSETK